MGLAPVHFQRACQQTNRRKTLCPRDRTKRQTINVRPLGKTTLIEQAKTPKDRD